MYLQPITTELFQFRTYAKLCTSVNYKKCLKPHLVSDFKPWLSLDDFHLLVHYGPIVRYRSSEEVVIVNEKRKPDLIWPKYCVRVLRSKYFEKKVKFDKSAKHLSF